MVLMTYATLDMVISLIGFCIP